MGFINIYNYPNKINEMNIQKKLYLNIIKFFLLFYFLYSEKNIKFHLTQLKNEIYKKKSILIPFKKYNINKLLNNHIKFNMTYLNYSFSYKYNIAKIEYSIIFYDENDEIIFPSDVILYNDINIFCHFKTNNINNIIYSIANIYNKYFICIEFFNMNENIYFGIIINKYNENYYYSNYSLFLTNGLIYNNIIYENPNIFDPLYINDEFISLVNKMNDKLINESFKLKKSYIKYPICILKRNVLKKYNTWVFKNIYNHYFCFCSSLNCLNLIIYGKCKYKLYLNIIDNNRNLYPKTNYLFMDFIFTDLSSDDVYPVFKEMEKQKYPVHYLTERLDLYEHYRENNNNSFVILLVKNKKRPIDGDFLEKYLSIFLKLKIVVSGRGTTFNTNIFYNIEYISYICVGHGVCYFKYFLYEEKRIYGDKKNDILLLPPSEKIVLVAKKYGWNDNNIIKINLPRWDKYNNDEINIIELEDNENIKSNSILIMFTWRDILKNKEISFDYFKNIKNLIYNDELNKELNKNNIVLYTCFHRLIDKKYIKKYIKKSKKYKNLEFINQNEISECLKKTNLVVTDFSSIIFDIMYRKKPFIIYIPDADDKEIINIYKSYYYELIESMKNGTIFFENKYLNLDETINKIIYYINYIKFNLINYKF